MNKNNKVIFFVVNVDWFFLSHRLPLALQAMNKGYRVYLLAANTGKKEEIENFGIHFIEVPFERSGRNILHELKCVFILTKLYKQYQPDIIHQVTLKAAILGSIAAKKAKIINVINAISGFGYNFTNERSGILQRILNKVLLYAFKSRYFYFIIQNPDDERVLHSLNITSQDHIRLIKGSGVDLDVFKYSLPIDKGYIEFLFPARILLDKGVIEFIEAAKSLRNELQGKAKFILSGDCDINNLAVLTEDKLKSLLEYNYIEWIGFQKDMVEVYERADVTVLPSYREGLPKSLIEACATGRPLITTNAPGCKECVIEGYNGYIVPIKSVEPLAKAMLALFKDKENRIRMGENSRKLAEREFSIGSVVKKHFLIYDELIKRKYE